MSPRTRAAVGIGLMGVLAASCTAASRHKVLTTLFDGVPPPKTAAASAPAGGHPASSASQVRVEIHEHPPFAAKACDACHDKAATNALVAPPAELCVRCHDVDTGVKHVHGPLASGGCLVCHDPHSSRYASLLVAEAGTFCFRCHDRADLSRIDEHADLEADCTACHNAHGSDSKYLLR